MWSSAASFGAPVTDPGGNVAPTSSAQPTPGRSRPVDGATPGGRGRGAARPRTAPAPSTEPHSHTRPRSLRTRSTIITFSARSLAQEAAAVGGGALDGRRPHPVGRRGAGTARATPTPRGTPCAGQADDRASTAPGCPRPARRRGRRRRRPAGSGARQPAGEVHLVHVAGGDGLADGVARPAQNAVAVEARSSTASTGGPAPRRPRPRAGRADRRRSGRSTGAPSNGSTTAQKPVAVEGGEVGGDVDQVGQQPAADDGRGRAPPGGYGPAARRTIRR